MASVEAAPTGAAAKRWAKRVERLERSGLTIRTFAEREGLKAGSLSFWKWKLAQERGGRSGSVPVGPLKFVELMTAPDSARSITAASPGFEVLLRSGQTVRVPGGFDAAELARLVVVLEEARS